MNLHIMDVALLGLTFLCALAGTRILYSLRWKKRAAAIKVTYDSHPAVGQTFPDFMGRFKQLFVEWMTTSGRAKPGLSPQPEQNLPTVTYFGYLGSRLGIGEAARGYIGGLRVQGLPVQTVNVSRLSSSETGEWESAFSPKRAILPDSKFNLFHVNPDQLFNLRDELTVASLKGRYNIGVWAWETLKFPEEWFDRFALLDEIWVGGSFMGKAIAEVSPVPVIHMPHIVNVPPTQPDRQRFGIPKGEYVFLFMFDFFSTTARKNPAAVIESFRKAFGPNDAVRLFLKSMNGSNSEEFARLRKLAQGLKVTFLDRALNGEERFVLLSSCDAFVSLHRAEGFGLCLAEAMAMGKPVIATGWSGNMDYMDTNNSLPVRFELKELAEDSPPYRAGTLWAEPDTDHAAELMRKIWRDTALAEQIGTRARGDIKMNFSPEAIGEKMMARLNLVGQGLPRAKVVTQGLSALPPAIDQQFMKNQYQLLKMLRQDRINWDDFLHGAGGFRNASLFAARLPGFWASRTAERFHRSVSKRMSKR